MMNENIREVITRKHIKLFSGNVNNNLGMKVIEKEFYKWANADLEENTSIDIVDIKMSTHNGFAYVLVIYITITMPEKIKDPKPTETRYSSHFVPDGDYTKENICLNSFKEVIDFDIEPDKSVEAPEPDVIKGED